MISELEHGGLIPDDIFFEYLDLLHLPDKRQRQALAKVLEHKYATLGIDLIICVERPAIDFLFEELDVIEDTASDSIEQMLDRVARLPSNSVVIFGNFFEDQTGRTFTPLDVCRKVEQAANVPVFGLYDTLMNQGIVGGSLLSFAAEGTRVAHRALDLLAGRLDPAAHSSVLVGDPIPIFDWRQIQRWNGLFDQLPPDSIFINREPSLWHQYRWAFLATGAIMAIAVIENISDQKTAEEALRESEERLRFALESNGIGAWELDLIDKSALRSIEHDRIFGYTELLPEWTYDMFLSHVLPEDRGFVDEEFRRTSEIGSEWNFECRIRRVDGEVRWIWAAGRQRIDAAGNVNQMAGLVQDITERKRLEEKLKESEARLTAILDQLPVGVGL